MGFNWRTLLPTSGGGSGGGGGGGGPPSTLLPASRHSIGARPYQLPGFPGPRAGPPPPGPWIFIENHWFPRMCGTLAAGIRKRRSW